MIKNSFSASLSRRSPGKIMEKPSDAAGELRIFENKMINRSQNRTDAEMAVADEDYRDARGCGISKERTSRKLIFSRYFKRPLAQ